MEMLDLLGFVAGALTTAAFLPQVIKTWQSKSASEQILRIKQHLLLPANKPARKKYSIEFVNKNC